MCKAKLQQPVRVEVCEESSVQHAIKPCRYTLKALRSQWAICWLTSAMYLCASVMLCGGQPAHLLWLTSASSSSTCGYMQSMLVSYLTVRCACLHVQPCCSVLYGMLRLLVLGMYSAGLAYGNNGCHGGREQPYQYMCSLNVTFRPQECQYDYLVLKLHRATWSAFWV